MFPRLHMKCIFRFSNSHEMWAQNLRKFFNLLNHKSKYLNFFAFSFCQLSEFVSFSLSLSLLFFQGLSLNWRSQFQLYACGQSLLSWSTLKPKSLSYMPIIPPIIAAVCLLPSLSIPLFVAFVTFSWNLSYALKNRCFSFSENKLKNLY